LLSFKGVQERLEPFRRSNFPLSGRFLYPASPPSGEFSAYPAMFWSYIWHISKRMSTLFLFIAGRP
jgi:hypothetical protein